VIPELRVVRRGRLVLIALDELRRAPTLPRLDNYNSSARIGFRPARRGPGDPGIRLGDAALTGVGECARPSSMTIKRAAGFLGDARCNRH
jgi:hypothetical protein